MFPNYDERDIQERLEVKGFDLALQSLLDSSELVVVGIRSSISIRKNCGRATSFYKATKNSPEKLVWNLVVVLEEEGIDAVAP